MKVYLVLGMCLLSATITGAHAQGTPDKKIEEKVAIVHDKFAKAMDLEKNKRDEIDSVFTVFYTEQQRLRENIQGPVLAQGLVQQDFQSVRQRNDNLINDREDRLKKLLTPEQYKKWKEEIAPSLRATRQRDK